MNSYSLIENINDSKNNENQYEIIEPQIENNKLPIIEYSNYFPSENSKKEGNKIFISSVKEENRNETHKQNESEKKQLLNINNGTNISLESIGIKKNYTDLIAQRVINFIIDKTFIFLIENGNQTIKEKNNSDKINNQKDDNNINILGKEELKQNENNFNIKTENDNLKPLKVKQNKKLQKTSQSIDNIIKNRKAYIRKINIAKKNFKENGISNNNKSQKNINNNGINDINDIKCLQESRNTIIRPKITQNTFQESDSKKNNLKNNILLKNDSLSDFVTKNKKSNSQLNRSLEMKDSINFYDSLNILNSNIKDNINKSKIMDISFLSGIKNEERKNALQNALSIYNRYKNINKLEKLNIFNSPSNSKKNEINSKNNELNTNPKKEEEKKEENNVNIDEESESEFSFTIKLKKKDENNNNNENGILTEIINKELNISNQNSNIENENKNINDFKKNEDNNDNFINIINYKIKDDNNNGNIIDKENIKDNKKRIKPSYFVRKLIREEHYYIDENGNEKLLEVKQKYINDEDQKNMKVPYVKKNLNLKGNLNSSKNKENSKIEKNNLLNLEQSLNKEEAIPKENNIKTSNYKRINNEVKIYNDKASNYKKLNIEDKKSKVNNIKTSNYERLINKDKDSKENNIKTSNYERLINEDKDSKENNIKISNYERLINVDKDSKEKNTRASRYKKLNNIKKNKINLIYNNSKENTNILEKRIKNTLKLFESRSPKITNKKYGNNTINNNFSDLFSIKNNKINTKKEIKRRNTNIDKNKTQNNTNSQKQLNIIDQKKDNRNIGKNLSNNIRKESKTVIYYPNNKDIKKSPIIALNKYNNYNLEDDSINVDESYHHLNTVTYTTNDSINYKDSYIKVNKMPNKYRNLHTERSIERSTDTNNNNKLIRKDLNKNHHSFHEVKIIKNKLSSNSQSNYYSKELSLDELSINLNAFNNHKFLIKPIKKEKINQVQISNKNDKIQNKIYYSNSDINKQKHFTNKSNSNSYFSIKVNKNNNTEKSNHKYYESKSTKKIENEGYIGRHNTYSSNLDNPNYNNLYKSYNKEKYFYQNWNFGKVLTLYNNNNN